MNFTALDIETANADRASICQVGIAVYENGELVHEWKSLVDPLDRFDFTNVSIHGIDARAVKGAPTLPEIASVIGDRVRNRVVVSHTQFDRTAIAQAFTRHSLVVPGCVWLDSAKVARRAWEQFARGGYGLKNVCDSLGYEFAHHDALEDAKAAAYILLSAIDQTGMDLEGWLKRVQQPIRLPASVRIQQPPNIAF